MTLPTFALTDLRKGLHDETLRELAANSVGKVPCSEWKSFVAGSVSFIKNYFCGHDKCYPAGNKPNYHTSLDACRELLESLTVEERQQFPNILSDVVDARERRIEFGFKGFSEFLMLLLLTSARDQLIAFCLTRKLIQLNQNES